MKTEEEVLKIIRELYTKMNKDPGEIMKVRAKDGDFYAKRADGAIAKIPGALIDDYCGPSPESVEKKFLHLLGAGFFMPKGT